MTCHDLPRLWALPVPSCRPFIWCGMRHRRRRVSVGRRVPREGRRWIISVGGRRVAVARRRISAWRRVVVPDPCGASGQRKNKNPRLLLVGCFRPEAPETRTEQQNKAQAAQRWHPSYPPKNIYSWAADVGEACHRHAHSRRGSYHRWAQDPGAARGCRSAVDLSPAFDRKASCCWPSAFS